MTTPHMPQRKALIAAIAKRHRAEDELVKSVLVEMKRREEMDQYSQIVQGEFESLQKQSTFLR